MGTGGLCGSKGVKVLAIRVLCNFFCGMTAKELRVGIAGLGMWGLQRFGMFGFGGLGFKNFRLRIPGLCCASARWQGDHMGRPWMRR